jgi:ABC-type polysaccharide/polyol phosphate transport system ATPase subunit
MFKNSSFDPPEGTAIHLEDVSVSYRVPTEKVGTIKEYAIRKIQRKIKYEHFLALDRVNMTIRKGEIFGIIGRNGAGKSTLLKVVSRVLIPTNGRVWSDGTVSPLLELGAGFHPELTGMENIFLNGTLLGHKHKDIEGKIPGIIEFSEIGDFINAPIRTYSSGMIARLGFSIATAWNPEILILDEILSVGDAAFAQKCQSRMNSIRESGCTILLVTHSIEMIRSMCRQVMLLDHGRVLGIGAGEEITTQYSRLLASQVSLPG